MTPDQIHAWITARLDEDERAARAVASLRPTWTTAGGYEETGPTRVVGDDGYLIVEDETDWAAEIVTHVAIHDPARALREVEAGRRRLDRHQHVEYDPPTAYDLFVDMMSPGHPIVTCRDCGEAWPCPDMVDDAQSWADRDDMPEELKLP